MSMAAFIVFGTFVIVGSSNAVNLTDGLDGLAILPTVLIGGGLGLIAYAMGNQLIADYLFIPHLPIAGELIVFCGALIGSGIGFLWYNTYPAQVFMGDVGSLTLGAILGVLAVVLRHEIVYAIMAGVFIVETLSVMIQVTSYRLFKIGVFLMAPIHHQFELKGWAEPKIIVRFWIITLSVNFNCTCNSKTQIILNIRDNNFLILSSFIVLLLLGTVMVLSASMSEGVEMRNDPFFLHTGK